MSEILHDDVNVLEIHGIGDFSLHLSEGLYTWSGVSPERRRRITQFRNVLMAAVCNRYVAS